MAIWGTGILNNYHDHTLAQLVASESLDRGVIGLQIPTVIAGLYVCLTCETFNFQVDLEVLNRSEQRERCSMTA